MNDARNYSFSQVPYLEHEERENWPINLRERRDVILHQVRALVHRLMADKPGKMKPKKLSNVGTTKRKEIPVSKTEQEIFEATKLVIETTCSKV